MPTLYTPHLTLHTLRAAHSTLHTWHSTLYTLYTPHSALDTPHLTLYMFHSTLYTPHLTLYIPHFTHGTLRDSAFFVFNLNPVWHFFCRRRDHLPTEYSQLKVQDCFTRLLVRHALPLFLPSNERKMHDCLGWVDMRCQLLAQWR